MWEQFKAALSQHSEELLMTPISAGSRVFVLYLLGATVMAYWLYRRSYQANQEGKPGFLAYLFPKSQWLHQSARTDYKLFVINKLLWFPLLLPFALSLTTSFLLISGALDAVLGLREPLIIAPWLLTLSFTVALFVMDDLSRFILHWALHKVSWLWEFHKIHHSAETLTPFTIFRSHPVENFLYSCRSGLSQGIVIAIFYRYFGDALSAVDILGANLFTFLFNMAGSNLRHSHIWLSWGPKVERWLISPAQHQVHHGSDARYFDKNFGAFLAIWDRFAGTLVLAPKERIRIDGLKESAVHNASLVALYSDPFRQNGKRFRTWLRHLKNRIGIANSA